MAPSYVYRHRVTFDETNLVGNVYFAHYVSWQGHCREHFLAEHAPGVVKGLAEGFALVTLSCAVDFYEECGALDEVEVHMSLGQIAGNRIEMAFDYLRVNGGPPVVVARGRQLVACMRRVADGLEPVSIPDDLRLALEPYVG